MSLQNENPIPTFKLQNANLIIKKALSKFPDQSAVSWSGGKDSTLVLYLTIQQQPNIKVLFENTLIEFPETIQFIRKLTKQWNLNLIETKPSPDHTFAKCLKKYGLPKPRQTNKQGKNREPKCCYYLKKQPALKAIKENNIYCLLTGITTAESQTRGFLNRYNHCTAEKDNLHYTSFFYYTKDWNCWKFNPIINWTEKEVFDIHKTLNIPLNEVYTKWNNIYKRCGCLPCTAYLDWEKKLSKTHPKYYTWLKTFQKDQYKKLV